MKMFVWSIITSIFLPIAIFALGENWIYIHDNIWYKSEATSIVYGTDGNVYAAGYNRVGSIDGDFIVVSLTTQGDTNWIYKCNSPGYYYDAVHSLVYGTDDNIYAAGIIYNNFAVVSLATAGDTNWIYQYNGSGNSYDIARSIAYGPDGNIYAAGYSYENVTSDDFTVISLSPAGDTNWVYRYDGPGNAMDRAHSIVCGLDGNIYAAGISASSGTDYDFIVISLTTNGVSNWIYRYNGSASGHDEARSIDYGLDGNIYAAGLSTGIGTGTDFTVISLTSAGDSNWIYQYNGPANSMDGVNDIAYGADNNIYAAGYCKVWSDDRELTVISLTTSGDTNWVYSYDDTGNEFDGDRANSIVYGLDGNIYVAGILAGYNPHLFTVVSLNAAGDTNWVYLYYGPTIAQNEALSITYGADGNIYAAGYCQKDDWWDDIDFTVISLPPDLGIREDNQTIINKTCFGSTVFRGPLQLPEGKKCKVFDIAGRIVEPTKITRGIYFIEIDNRIVQKVIKIR